MKLWDKLTEEERGRAAHMFQHDIIDNFLQEGFTFETKTEEDKEELRQIQACLEKAKTLEDHSEKVDLCFDDEATFNATLSIALDIAQNSYFIEEGESAMFLSEINECFDDDPEGEPVDEDEGEQMAEILQFPVKSKKHSIN